jgi:cytochrome b561
MDYALGLIAALSMGLTLGTGIALTLPWWELRIAQKSADPVVYSTVVSAAHNIMSMLVLTFVGAHLAAVLMRDSAAKRR